MPFDAFVADCLSLYERLVKELAAGNRQFVIGSGKRALAVLHNYDPQDVEEEMLLESTIEIFEDLVRKAGGTP